MKEANIQNLIRLLILAGWSTNKIEDIFLDIKKRSQNQLLSEIYSAEDLEKTLDLKNFSPKKISGLLRSDTTYFNPKKEYELVSVSLENIKKHSNYHTSEYNPTKEIIDKIIKMLVHDAHLSAKEIHNEFSKRLKKNKTGTLPPLSKKSLSNWLERTLNIFTASEILHIATSILNDKKTIKRIDWSVRNDKEP